MKIPTPTLLMLNASAFVQSYWMPAAVTLIAAIAAFQTYIRTDAGRLWWDGFRLKLPMLGDALRKAETARFARAMSTLVAASVPLVQSLGISRGILNNKRISNSLESIAQGVKRGEGIATPLRKAGEFPPLAAIFLPLVRRPDIWTPCLIAWQIFTTLRPAMPSAASPRCLSR